MGGIRIGAGHTAKAPGGCQNAGVDTPAPQRVRDTTLQLALPLAITTFAVLMASLPVFQFSAYAGVSPGFALLDRVAGLGMVAAGIIAWFGFSRPLVGLLAMVAGLLWLMPDVVGWRTGSHEERSVAAVLVPLLTVLLAHLIAESRRGAGAVLSERAAIGTVYLLTLMASIGSVLIYDHALDPTCWADCSGAPLIRLVPPVAVRTAQVAVLLMVCIGAILLAIESARWARSHSGSRRQPMVLLTVSGLAFAAVTLSAALLTMLRLLNVRPLGIHVPAENPAIDLYQLTFVLRGGALVAIAVGLIWRVMDERRTATRVRRLAAALEAAPAPGSLQAALADALGDPTLRVLYWLEHEQRYVDDGGHAIEPPDPASGSPVTHILRAGRPVAMVVNASRADIPALQRELGAAALAAVDNERLRAAVLSQIAELRSSRVRIVELGDAERRRLERDLHDGAQQRLLAISYDLRTARAAAGREEDAELVARLDRGQAEISAAVEELRQLAHGIYPAILTEAGLQVALAAFAEESPVAMELTSDGAGPRCPSPVEAAAYQLVAETATEAARRGASHLRVVLTSVAGRLAVDVSDDAPAPIGSLVRAADRVWAAGGGLEVGMSTPGPGAFVHAELPCG